ncbi:MAG TPA: hypothetical protein VJ986_13700 [Gaiellaceae bacterium]|nr:hypothetical protein [Gaiellaceae bacterium]
MASRTRSRNHRATAAVLAGFVALAAIPAAIYLAQRSQRIGLLDAAFAIPVAAVFGVAAVLLARGARGTIVRTLERAGGFRRIRYGRLLGILGICVALSASIAVGFYELLVRLEG